MSRSFEDLYYGNSYLDGSAPSIADYPFTLSCWAYVFSSGVAQVIFFLGNSANNDSWLLRLESDNKVIATARDVTGGSGNDFAETTSTFSDTTWHHFCAVFESDNSRAVYIDGGSKGTNSTNVNFTSVAQVLIAGQLWNGSLSLPADTAQAEHAIWNAALSDAEVARLAAQHSPLLVRPQSLVTYIPLIRTDQDFVGGNNLTPQGGPGWITTHLKEIKRPNFQILVPLGTLSAPGSAGQFRTLLGVGR